MMVSSVVPLEFGRVVKKALYIFSWLRARWRVVNSHLFLIKYFVQANSQKSDEREEENMLLLMWRKKRCKQRARDVRAPGVGDGEVVGSWQRHYNEVEDGI
jgi:hypothetical protein